MLKVRPLSLESQLLQGHFQLGLFGEAVNFSLPGGGELQGARIHRQAQPTGLHE
jgi:hypothetical protein